MILVVDPSNQSHQAIGATNFHIENVWERRHIQEWVRHHPEILGEELLVVSIEFDRFDRSDDRLDALAVDRYGNLVVIEFKRTADAGAADLQALRYASMVSTLTMDLVSPYYADYLGKYCGEGCSTEDAKERIRSFVTAPDFADLSDRPRMILCAQDFGPELTTSVLWLRGFDIDMCCVRITPHKVGEQLIIVPERIIPLPEAQAYMVSVNEKKVAERVERSTKRAQTFRHLLNTGLVKKGDRLQLRANLPSYVSFDENDTRLFATVTGKTGQSDAVIWDHDGKEYAVSTLAHRILNHFHPDGHVPGAINGNVYWTVDGTMCLWELAWGQGATHSGVSEAQ